MMACMYAWLALVSAATYAWLALVSAAMCKCACAWDKWTESLWLGSLSGIPNALKAWKQRRRGMWMFDLLKKFVEVVDPESKREIFHAFVNYLSS